MKSPRKPSVLFAFYLLGGSCQPGAARVRRITLGG
jgi:hypothetical protein